MTAGMPTFQQTFANCPFPEGVLAALGSYPVRVRVLKAQRAMEVIANGAVVSQDILSQAADGLKQAFGLNAATVAVDQPQAGEPEKTEEEKHHHEGKTVPGPAERPVPEPGVKKTEAATETQVPRKEPSQDLESQMKAMRRKLMGIGRAHV